MKTKRHAIASLSLPNGSAEKRVEGADWEVRLEAVEKLRGLPVSERRKRLIRGLGDSAELVRVAAIDQLTYSPESTLRPALIAALSDRSQLVRTHAVAGLVADSRPTDKELLKLHLRRSRSTFRVALLGALYSHGEAKALNELLTHISTTNDYLDVCVGARTLASGKANSKNRRQIKRVLLLARKRWRSAAVTDAVRDAMRSMQ